MQKKHETDSFYLCLSIWPKILLVSVLCIGLLTVPTLAQQTSTAAASSEAETLQELKAEVKSLSNKVQSLEDQQDLDEKTTQTQRLKNATTVTAGSNGFEIQSADKKFDLQLKGLLQTDVREFLTPANNGAAPGDGIYLRRARLIYDGTLWSHYSFRLEPEFGSRSGGAGGTSSTTATLANANVNINYWEPLQLLVGRFKGPVGYERSQLVADNIWIENGLTQNLTPNYDQAILVHGDVDNNLVSYGAGIMEGVRDNATNDIQAMSDNNYDFVGDIYVNPFKKSDIKALQGLGFGVAGDYGNRGDVKTTATSPLASYYTPGQTNLLTYNTTAAAGQTVTESEDGPGYRLTPVIYYYNGPFGGYADYAISSIRALRMVTGPGAGTGSRFATLQNEAWQVVGSYVLTGEKASYSGVEPRENFSISNHTWGAFQLVARYGELTLNNDYFTSTGASTSVGGAIASQGPHVTHDIGAGINWYLNPNIKAQLEYDYTSYTGGTWPVNPENADQNVFMTQLQLAF